MSSISFIGIDGGPRTKLAEKGIDNQFNDFVRVHGLRHAEYVSFSSPWIPRPAMIGTVSENQAAAFVQRAHLAISLAVENARKDNISVNWNVIKGDNVSSEQAAAMEQMKQQFGQSGLSIRLAPTPHIVGLTITADDDDDSWNERSAALLWKGMLFGQKLHQAIIEAHGFAEGRVWLSESQSSCLLSIASGMNVKDIAETFSLNESTVLRHLDKAQKKLQAHNHAHAVAKAIVLGLIAA